MNKPKLSYSQVLNDPLRFQQMCWPHLKFYDKQVEILYSLIMNDETVVPAGNQLGKDFITGFAALWFCCSRSPVKVVTSSAGQRQLSAVLWGEMRRFIATSRFPLPIDAKSMVIHQVLPDGTFEPRSYVQGVVTNVAENMLGHHLERGSKPEPMDALTGERLEPWDRLPRTLAIFDEASSIGNEFYEATDTWAHRKLVIGNPLPCSNFFFDKVKMGHVFRDEDDKSKGKHVNIIKIKASESPNVKLALAEIELGKEPSHREVIPGVVSYSDYQKRRKLWDPVRQSVGLDAEFYAGAEILLYPPEWLNASEQQARVVNARFKLRGKKRLGAAIGVDTAEGGDDTCWTVVDHYGILDKISLKTTDTSDIPNQTLALMNKWKVKAENVIFDLGGGGKQHADVLRSRKHNVRVVGFGEAPTAEAGEGRLTYKNRRAELYGLLMIALEPPAEDGDKVVFAIPERYTELRRQLAPTPKLYDSEGRLYLPPKDRPTETYKGETIKQMLGCSPDEADSLVLANYGLVYPKKKLRIGVY